MTIRRKTIAVIDDHLGILSAMGRLLSTLGYSTELYASAKEFMDSALTSAATCLIVDIELGETCGIELARYLTVAGFKIPTVFMTAHDSESARARAREVGCIAFLAKPFSPAALMAALAKVPDHPPA